MAAYRIRALQAEDQAEWRRLWQGYLRFYRQRLPDPVTAVTFERLVHPQQEPHGLVAEGEAGLVGLAHYLFHRSTWSATAVCYLEDLFVDPGIRGHGAGRALIQAVYAAADAHGASAVYWMTQEFNAEARALYDTLAHRTSFIRYER
ncbi:MAG: GNAT family N-acetyltransferase [Gammaproteobacteria bacterium]|nr:GNAT family N-acetyltransferase [Gammaproteobacteria bacterium]MBV9622289.1 GNAT family N-acetyltransferase [Gammaproteobacteria bacterium]